MMFCVAILCLLVMAAAFSPPHSIMVHKPLPTTSSRPLTRHHTITARLSLNPRQLIRRFTRRFRRMRRRPAKRVEVTQLRQEEESVYEALSTAYQGVAVLKDQELDQMRIMWAIEMGSLNSVMIFQ
mmetsp:Transcript_16030/g.38246  ORF Transcript_16030/g.38246 Transcript_16030/m.38246 type:complete len:126 (-) Transcript_16030:291-668(-)